MEISTKTINEAQERWYKNGELSLVDKYIGMYSEIIEEIRERETVTILDIGGGAGYFVKELLRHVTSKNSKMRKIDIYLVDTHRYDTWDDDDRRIHFLEGNALDIDLICGGGGKFDYIFCNMFFHHLLGDSFKQSAMFRENCISKMKKVLKPDGKIGIIDNLNDGFLWDQASCRILYFFTTTKNPLVVRICKRMGSNSAGVGVCMLSRKMWRKLVNGAGMRIIDSVDSEPDKLGILKKVCLCNKSYREFNLMILQ
ncbi:MAG: class I SAM-dependent methyltransferase [Blautia sp.]|nr:class I SAM-dependent methyltransferase [Blautia sp.]MCM1202155.1 class I SAM-dependent methyltransferase [Bacteroides fragilis]